MSNLRAGFLLGFILWLIALIYSMILFSIIGIDYNETFGINHPKYWVFESIMTPSFFIFAGFVIYLYFHRTKRYDNNDPLYFGIVVMFMQFILDTLVLVFLFQNGFSYFFGLVTISYLLIPLYSHLIGSFIRKRNDSS